MKSEIVIFIQLIKLGYNVNILKCFNCDERGAIKDVLNRDHVVNILSKEKISREIHGAEQSSEWSDLLTMTLN